MTQLAPLIGLVDDSEEYRLALDRLLRSAGYRTLHFVSADAFLDSERNGEPDCLILDNLMPGTTGLQLAQRLTAMSHPRPFIMVSAAATDIREVALAVGAVAVLAKAGSANALLDAIAGALRTRTCP